jgi:hypothetical protein
MWSITRIGKEHSKILALWLNSTLNLLQTLILRTETRGAWMKVHDYMLSEMLVPNFINLSKVNMRRLMKTYDAVRNVRLPSILAQLRGRHPTRKLIDTAWLNTLGYKGDVEGFLNKLYDSLANEIQLLKELMAEEEMKEGGEESE